MKVTHIAALAAVTFASFAAAPAVQGQSWLKKARDKAKQKVEETVDKTTDKATDAALAKGENAVACAVGNTDCIKQAEASGKNVEVVDSHGKPVSSADSASAIAAAGGGAAPGAAPNAAPGADVQTNNDFTPGTRVIWSEDFSSAPTGDFPRSIELVSGNVEAATWKGKHFIRTNSSAEIAVPLSEVLPNMFTLEYDYTGAEGWDSNVRFLHEDTETAGGEVSCSTSGSVEINPAHGAQSSSDVGDFAGQIVHCAVMVDGKYVKGYINGKRAAQSPNAQLGRSNKVYFEMTGSDDNPEYITNIRIAAGGKDMYQALATEGRFTTQGILFATGSDQITPASAPVLTQIGTMLKAHADLKLEIDGHTDNVGSAASNQTLSEKRAAAVRQYLVSNFQIDASRLTSKGFGASKPVASNDTDAGKAQNRRVELVKM